MVGAKSALHGGNGTWVSLVIVRHVRRQPAMPPSPSWLRERLANVHLTGHASLNYSSRLHVSPVSVHIGLTILRICTRTMEFTDGLMYFVKRYCHYRALTAVRPIVLIGMCLPIRKFEWRRSYSRLRSHDEIWNAGRLVAKGDV